MNVEPIGKLLPYSTVAVALAILYVSFTFCSRREQEQQAAKASLQREVDAGRDSLNRVGGGDLKILQFFASPPAVAPGQKTELCYGVAFAKTVKIDPPTEAVWPSLGRCVDVKPTRTTHFTLTAEDGHGHKTSKTTDITVE